MEWVKSVCNKRIRICRRGQLVLDAGGRRKTKEDSEKRKRKTKKRENLESEKKTEREESN